MGETEKIETHRIRCFSKLKMFLLAITCAFISKTLSGSYMNSMLTQIERQFNIPTSLVGFINGSFEIGFVETGAIIGPLFGLLLASFCANVYVDIGSVNTGARMVSTGLCGYIVGR
ncbi:Solute carrier organic anion transporter family member 1A2 [Myotis brandtii]|uniref:Solute carrier organic anion transporter family member 1A2 n=1 Tax=Myotis brandtii TaxID=109478 RepID=S7PN70_MYOBR|nr:Solute carrier organic anion transporter family member 1A2 [Myotis brandtii]